MRFADLAPGPAPQLPLAAFAARREELARRMGPGHVLVVATEPPKRFSNDVEYVFRPHSDFWYLTGFGEPGAVLVLDGGSGDTQIFVRPRKKEAEVWTGRRLGVERAAEVLGIGAAFDIIELRMRLPQLVGRSKVHAIARHDPVVQRTVANAAGGRLVEDPPDPRPGGPRRKRAPPRGPVHARRLLHGMRLRKDAAEMRLLRRACDLGVAAHEAAARAVRPGNTEYQVEAAFLHHARWHGSGGLGYPSICGCGQNAAVLHYVDNRDALRAGELLLIDAGCEWGYYTSDITRTYPVGGAFSAKQLQLYDVVLRAHRAGIAQVKPGNPFSAPHEAAVEELTLGLIELGMLQGPTEKAIREKSYSRYFMHGTSHFLGLDVHDAGSSKRSDGKPRLLEPGMVLTVEPGLYFNADFAPCPPGTKGIGIRIEDDIAVTGSGHENLTRRLPVQPEKVAPMVRP